MDFNRIKISKDATSKLSHLKGRTGLTPNILCRFAFCLSLNDSTPINELMLGDDGQEFNRHTLTGEYDSIIVAMLKERLVIDGLDIQKNLPIQFRGHLNRGTSIMYSRVKTVSDLCELIPKNQEK